MKSKAQKQTEAKERRLTYEELSAAEKYLQIADRPGDSSRERRRLARLA